MQQLPTLGVIDTIVDSGTPIELQMCEFRAKILPPGATAPGVQAETWVWGYSRNGAARGQLRETYLGPAIVATRGTPTEIKYVNGLGSTGNSKVLAYTRSVDQTLHWSDPAGSEGNACAMAVTAAQPPGIACAGPYQGPIPAVPHLHGGEIPPELDGGPDAWYLSEPYSNYQMHGHAFHSRDGNPAGNYAIYRYPNSQEAGNIWFHDHTLGATRLNVYAGLAGAYVITDPPNDPQGLPGPIVPLIIQDRMFDTTGQLLFPAGVPFIPNPEHPLWVPEFLGDVICVNGKAWPFFNVEPKRYRFLFLNGSNARTYELSLINQVTGAPGPAMYVIGTDGGYLDAAVKIDPALGGVLTMMSGERYEVVIDFTGVAPGTNFILRNTGRSPYPKGVPPQGSTVGRAMQFRVVPSTGLDTSVNVAVAGAPVRKATNKIVKLTNGLGALAGGVTAKLTRQFTLNEVMGMPTVVNGVAYPGGPLEILVNNTRYDGKSAYKVPGTLNGVSIDSQGVRNDFSAFAGFPGEYFSELPAEGDLEIWEIVNLTADAHPMHTHLVQTQIINRQNFNLSKYNTAYNALFPGAIFVGGYGPPLHYGLGNPRALGGNPDITPYLQGPILPPAAQESGWKDTVIVPPGMVTRLAVRFAPTDTPAGASGAFPFNPGSSQHGYVWHCHIVDHEDNEMMRPYSVQGKTGATRTFVKGVDY